MPCGGEGPMIHNGAIIAANITRIAAFFKMDKCLIEFKNEREKRDLITAGAACGISAAFGYPIGGLLFSFEAASSFWTVPTMLKVFFASGVSAFTRLLLRYFFS